MATADQQAEKIASMSRTIVDLLGLVRVLREEYCALSEVFSISLDMARQTDRQLEAARQRYLWLLAQHRALMSGRTNAEERQAIEESDSEQTQASERAAA